MSGSSPPATRSSLHALLSRRPIASAAPLLISVPLITVHVGLLAVFDLGRSPWWTVGLLGAGVAAQAWAISRLERVTSIGAFMLVATILRCLLLPLPPTLSDDTLRYVWDGRVAWAGFNPYALAPEDEALAPLRDAAWERMPHKHVPTVYPPLALALFTLAGRLPAPPISLKLLLVAVDLLGCWLLLKLARRTGRPASRALWYCWSPLVALEVAGMGHVDALMVAALVSTVLFLVDRRAFPAATSAAAAVMAKIVPLVALPLWARRSGAPLRFVAIAGLLLVALTLPVVVGVGGMPPGLVTYGVSWEFNGPLYEPLWRLLDIIALDTHIKSGLDAVKDWSGEHERWNRFYPLVYPQLIAKAALAGLLLILLVLAWSQADPVAGTGRVFAALLLCGATFYPWYLLWVTPWAGLMKHRAWLALTALIPLSYIPQQTEIELFPWVFLAIWVPFFALLPVSRWSSA